MCHIYVYIYIYAYIYIYIEREREKTNGGPPFVFFNTSAILYYTTYYNILYNILYYTTYYNIIANCGAFRAQSNGSNKWTSVCCCCLCLRASWLSLHSLCCNGYCNIVLYLRFLLFQRISPAIPGRVPRAHPIYIYIYIYIYTYIHI